MIKALKNFLFNEFMGKIDSSMAQSKLLLFGEFFAKQMKCCNNASQKAFIMVY